MGPTDLAAGMALQDETWFCRMQHALGVDLWQFLSLEATVQERSDAPVAIGRVLIDQLADQRQKAAVFDLMVAPARLGRACQALDQVGAGNTQRAGDGGHREPSLRTLHNGSSDIGFLPVRHRARH
jgi:hypothetical protein